MQKEVEDVKSDIELQRKRDEFWKTLVAQVKKDNHGRLVLNQVSDFSKPFGQPEFWSQVLAVVAQCQRHGETHNPTCFKTATAKRKGHCRFHFPRQPCDDTCYDEVNKRLKVQRLDRWCVSFNDILAFCLRCNHDVNFLNGNASESHSTAFYVTKYLSKLEETVFDLATMVEVGVERMAAMPTVEQLSVEERCRKTIMKCFNCISSQQQMPATFVAACLLGHDDHYSSHKFESLGMRQFLTAYSDKQSDRDNEFFACVPTGGDAFVPRNFRLDYELRGNQLENLCVYEVKRLYNKQKKPKGACMRFCFMFCHGMETALAIWMIA